MQDDPKYLEALYNKALSLSILSKYEEAISNFNKVLEIDTTNVKSFIGKIYPLNKLERYDDVLECCDEVLRFDHENALSLYNKARVKAMRNELEEAMIILGKAFRLNPIYEQKSKSDPVFDYLFRKDR